MAVSDTVRFTLDRLVANRRAHEAAILAEHATVAVSIESELVDFEGEWIAFGELMLADRHMVHRDADGVLRASYPF